MDDQRTGWLFVAIQFALLGAIILSPDSDQWSTGTVVTAVGWFISGAGVAIAIAAALRLGSSLTPTPVPTAQGTLKTDGLYRFVRHPIYTGVLGVVAGIVIRSGSLITAALGAGLCVFFWVKSSWEEDQLRERYDGYDEYAARTGRFVPNPLRSMR